MLQELLGITYRDHISIEEVRNRIKQAIEPHDDLLTTIRPKAKVVRVRDQIIRACEDPITGNNTKRKEERQTEDEMGGQY